MSEREKPAPAEVPVEELVPHRMPFLFIKQLLLVEPEHSVAECAIDSSWIWKSRKKTVPGVLLIEAMAQTIAAATAYEAMIEERETEEGLLVAIRRFSFSGSVPAGEIFEIESWEGRMMKPFGTGRAIARYQNRVIAEGELQFISLNPEGGKTDR